MKLAAGPDEIFDFHDENIRIASENLSEDQMGVLDRMIDNWLVSIS